MKKRLLSILLAALMIVSLLPTAAFAGADGCTRTQKVTKIVNGETYQMNLSGRSKGDFTFEASGKSWNIKNSDGKYLNAADGRLVLGSTAQTAWTYSNGTFSTAVKTTQSNSGYWWGWMWIPGWGSRTVTTTYYLGTVINGQLLSSYCVPAELYKTVSGEHEYGKPVYADKTNHKYVCKNCGDVKIEAHSYNEKTGYCVCGAYNPAESSVKISVDVTEKTTKQFVGWWFWGTWKDVTTYTATIRTDAKGVMVTKVQYQLNGGRWTTGTCVSSEKPIETLKVRAWDNNGRLYEYTWQKDPAPTAYNVTAQVQGDHGTATVKVGDEEATTASQALEGTNLVFEATPNDGYEFDYWEVVSGGIDIEANKTNNPISLTMPDTALTLKAHFKAVVPSTYSIIVEDDGHGTASADPTSAAPGATVNLTATPNDGYAFKEWEIARGLDSITGNSFTMPSNEVKVKAVFEKEYAVVVEAQGHGTVSADVAKGVSGKEVNLTITPDEGYETDQITVVRGGVNVTDNKFNIGTADVKIRVTFKAIVPGAYDIIVEDDGHGTASADPTSAAPGATVNLTATPNDGYAFKEWQIDRGLEAGAITDNSFTMPSNEVKVKAIFERVYNITLQTNDHGTASATVGGETATTAAENAEVTLTATPDEGYQLKEWKTVSGDISVTDNKFTMPASNVTVQAVFEAIAPTAPTFKAVYDTKDDANTLTFYYDTVDHSGEGITVYEGSTGDNYLFDNSKSTGKKWGYNGIRKSVTSVVIDSTVANYTGLTSTAYMFDDMENAENISGAEYLDVSQVTNMAYMFSEYGYKSSTLNIVPDVSEWNTGKVTNMSNMFQKYGYKSTALNAVPDVSEWNTVNVTTVKYMFYCYGNCSTALSTVPDVSRWNTGNLTNLASMFSNYGCVSNNLDFTLDLSGWSVASVDITDDSKMFYSAATKAGKWSVTIPKFTGTQANNETHWYVGDGTATEAYIEPASGKQFTVKTTIADVLDTVPSGFPTSDDTAWVNENGLKAYKDGDNIRVGNLTLGKDTTVTKSGDNYVCKSGDATVTFNVKDGAAESITVTGSGDSNGTYAAPAAPTEYTVTFDLNGITGTAPEAQTIKDGEKVTKPADPTVDGYTFGGWYKEATCTNAWDFANDTVTANTTLYAKWKPENEGSYILKEKGNWFKAFSETTTDKSKITDIIFCKELPQGVSAENPVNLTDDSENGKVKGYIVADGANYIIYIVGDYIFGNTDCTQMFSGFKNLTTLNLGHFDTSNVTNMTAMFMTCNALKTLDLSRFDTSSVTNMINMFDGCKALESLNLSKFDTSKVEYMMRMFSTCENLKTLDLSKFNTTSVTTMNAMFQNCSALETIKFGADFDTSKVTTMADMFKDCTKLQSLDLSKFSTSAVERMTNMFQNCETLTTLDLSSFDTSKVTSMNNMFKGCGSLETIGLDGFTVGNETTVVDMFDGCSKLTSVKISPENEKIATALGDGWTYNEVNGAYEKTQPAMLAMSVNKDLIDPDNEDTMVETEENEPIVEEPVPESEPVESEKKMPEELNPPAVIEENSEGITIVEEAESTDK